MSAPREQLADQTSRWRSRLCWGAAAGLLLLFVAQGLGFLDANSQTFDEAVYIVAGYSYLDQQDFRINKEHPPLVKLLAALPLYLGYRLPFDPNPGLWQKGEQYPLGYHFLYNSTVPADRILFLARLPSLILGTALVALVGWWSYRLWGRGAALLGMGLAAFEPNLIAHSCLVGNDLPLAFFLFLTLYLLWENRTARSGWLLAAAGVSTGLMLATKYSGLQVAVVLGLLAVLHVVLGGYLPLPWLESPDRVQGVGTRLLSAVLALWFIGLLALFVVACTYLGADPETWLDGFQWQRRHQESGHNEFFLGEIARHGWWSYFLVAFLIKTPVGSLVAILASLLCYFQGRRMGLAEVVFLFVPAAVCFAALTLLKANNGLRYILPIYPFLFVLASRLATIEFRPSWAGPVLLLVPLLATAGSSLRTAPHQLAYFNEVIGGPEQGYRYLSSSNLDWGQGLKELEASKKGEGLEAVYLCYYGTGSPEFYGIRNQSVPGPWFNPSAIDLLPETERREILAISVTNLQGVWFDDKDRFQWLADRPPLARIGYSIHLYDLTGDVEAHLRLAELYRRHNLLSGATSELKKVLALDPGNAAASRMLQDFLQKGSK